MSFRERTILVIASGLALAVLAQLFAGLLVVEQVDVGWFTYDPSTGPMVDGSPVDSHTDTLWGAAAIWLAAIFLWALIALRIYGGPGPTKDGERQSIRERLRHRDERD